MELSFRPNLHSGRPICTAYGQGKTGKRSYMPTTRTSVSATARPSAPATSAEQPVALVRPGVRGASRNQHCTLAKRAHTCATSRLATMLRVPTTAPCLPSAPGRRAPSRAAPAQHDHTSRACTHGAETKPCNHGPCPIHCATTAFSAWTTCTKSCGTGSQLRSRSIATHARHGGYVCPYLAERPSAARRAHTARRRARATRSPAR